MIDLRQTASGFSFSRFCPLTASARGRAKPAWLGRLVEIYSRPRRCGNVENLACFWRDFQGLVKGVGSLLLAFHTFHSPAFPRRSFPPGVRHRLSSANFAFFILRAAAVSLLAPACCCRVAALIPSFKEFSQSGSDVSFS